MEVLLQWPVRCSNECLKPSSFLAPHFERAKPCRLQPAPVTRFLKALECRRTLEQLTDLTLRSVKSFHDEWRNLRQATDTRRRPPD
jgi:hypothetical protein